MGLCEIKTLRERSGDNPAGGGQEWQRGFHGRVLNRLPASFRRSHRRSRVKTHFGAAGRHPARAALWKLPAAPPWQSRSTAADWKLPAEQGRFSAAEAGLLLCGVATARQAVATARRALATARGGVVPPRRGVALPAGGAGVPSKTYQNSSAAMSLA